MVVLFRGYGTRYMMVQGCRGEATRVLSKKDERKKTSERAGVKGEGVLIRDQTDISESRYRNAGWRPRGRVFLKDERIEILKESRKSER